MEAVVKTKRAVRTKTSTAVPTYLIYEELDGKPVYYRGYRDVLAGRKTAIEIMGASELQSLVNSVLVKYLSRHLSDNYLVVATEAGLHVKKNSNFSADIAIYDKAQFLDGKPITKKYSERPPKVIVEIDIQGEMELSADTLTYYQKKTQQLLDFGVQQLFWFFTDTRKVVIAEPGKPWLVADWSHELVVLGQHRFSIKHLVEQSGLPFVFSGD